MKTKKNTTSEATYGGGALRAPLAGSPACVFVFVFVLIYVELEFSPPPSPGSKAWKIKQENYQHFERSPPFFFFARSAEKFFWSTSFARSAEKLFLLIRAKRGENFLFIRAKRGENFLKYLFRAKRRENLFAYPREARRNCFTYSREARRIFFYLALLFLVQEARQPKRHPRSAGA